MRKTVSGVNLIIITCLAITMSLVGGMMSTGDALAADHKCGGTKTFFDWNCDPAQDNEIQSLLVYILNWLAVGVAAAVVGGIVYGAITIASSGGNEANTKKGIDIIRNAIIALILYFGMWSILNFIVPGGLFD